MFRTALPLTTALLSACVATDDRGTTAPETDEAASALTCSTYTVVDLGLPAASGGGNATAIDDAGNVAGSYQPTSVAISHAFRWNGSGNLIDLGARPGSSSLAHGISGTRVVGEAPVANGDGHAILADSTGVHDLGTLGGGGIDASAAYSVNANGVTVGKSRSASGFMRAAQFSIGSVIDLGTLTGTATSNAQALAVNGGVIVGVSDTLGGVSHAAKWSGESITDLGSVGSDSSIANAVNATGVAAGNILHDFQPRPAKFSGGSVTLVPIVSGFDNASATGINDAGLIVGTMTHPNGEAPATLHGYIYDGTTSTDLNTLVTGWTITAAVAINNHGAIAGSAVPSSGSDHRSHAVVIKPTCK